MRPHLAPALRLSVSTAALVSTCLLLFTLAPAVGHAQTRFPRGDFSAVRFYQAPGSGNFMMVDGAEVTPELLPSAGFVLDFAHNPFTAVGLDCLTGNDPECIERGLEEHQLSSAILNLQLTAAITVFERVQIGLNVPVLLHFDGEGYSWREEGPMGATPRQISGGSGTTLGDPRLHVKVTLLDPPSDGNGFSLAAAGWVTAPVGQALSPGRFVGDPLPMFGGHFIAQFAYEGLRLAVNVGGAYRDEVMNIRSAVGPEMTFGGAISYRLHPLATVLGEVTGATSFGTRFDSEVPLEVRGGGQLHIGDFTFTAGAGAGLVYGVGVPIFRVLGGMSWTPAPDRDTDGDGIPDSRDACPSEPEDLDGFQDEDGCPEYDNDEDGIPDEIDRCPDEPEDMDGFEDEDGCPDPDNDQDGVSDDYDLCPNEPEDRDGIQDSDGCPEEDADGDGIPDEVDRCPLEAEDFDGLEDEDGCPDEDVDGDGIPDEIDRCPEEPEDMDGFEDEDGCPDGGGRARPRR